MRRLRAASRESRCSMFLLSLERAAALKAKSRAIWARTEATSARRLDNSDAMRRSTPLK